MARLKNLIQFIIGVQSYLTHMGLVKPMGQTYKKILRIKTTTSSNITCAPAIFQKILSITPYTNYQTNAEVKQNDMQIVRYQKVLSQANLETKIEQQKYYKCLLPYHILKVLSSSTIIQKFYIRRERSERQRDEIRKQVRVFALYQGVG